MPNQSTTQTPDPLQIASRLYSEGRLSEARRVLMGLSSSDARFLNGLLLLEEGNAAEALQCLSSVDDFSPPASWAHRLGRLFFEKENYTFAKKWLREALKKNPSLGATHYWLGNTLRMTGAKTDAENHLKEAIRLERDPIRAHVALAYLYREDALLKDAAETMMSLVRHVKKDTEMMQRVARFLSEIRRYDLAEKVLSQIMLLEADNPTFLVTLGQLRQKLGIFDEAAVCFRRALLKDPNADAAYIGLVVIRKFQSIDDPDALIVRSALESSDLKPMSQTCAHFAMGKIFDDLKRYDEAYAHFELGNRMRASSEKFDLADLRQRFTAITKMFGADVFKGHQAHSFQQPNPIFIVGMLRSGTSLLEKLLGAHPEIYGAGELNYISALAEEMITTDDSGNLRAVLLHREALQEAAHFYLKTLSGYSSNERMVIDKNPLNFIHLGLIALLFPNAKIIHCRRDPLDTSLSIYFQNFAHADNSYAYDLVNIAAFYREQIDLMQHWFKVLPIEICTVDYEDLIAAPEKNLRRILSYLGLDYDEKCLGQTSDDLTVATASLWQVRQPLYQSSVGRWRNYEKHIASLVDALQGIPDQRMRL